jgi:multidrug efflux pump subunit AcrA (membrane-fusion protein)
MSPVSAPKARAGEAPVSSVRIVPARGARRLLLWAAAAALLAGALLAWWLLHPEAVKGVWVQASRAAFNVAKLEMGVVVAHKETQVLSGFTGEVVWMIEEGTFVEPGTVIVRFDPTQAQNELEQLKKDLFDKEDAVRAAERALEAALRSGELDVATQTVALEVAKLNRQEVHQKPTDDERREAELTLRAAKLRYEQAQREQETYQELYERGYVSNAVLKQKHLNFANQKVGYAKARIVHQLTLEGSTADQKRVADLAVADAEQVLATAKFNETADAEIAKANLELSRIEMDNFKLTLGEKVRYCAEAEVKAPARGRVSFVDVWKGSRGTASPIRIGESRNRGQDLCKIADVSALRVQTRVSEADVKRVAVGKTAAVRLPAIPGKEFRARVSEIALVAQDKNRALSSLAVKHSGQAFVNVVQVRLDFEGLGDEDRGQMRLGLTAEVSIEHGEEHEALLIPWSAVLFTADGQAGVEVRGGFGQPVLRPVKVGRGDALRVEVLEGLAEGEWVLDRGLRSGNAAAPPAPKEKAGP